MLVGKRMTRNPKTVTPDDPLSHAAGSSGAPVPPSSGGRGGEAGRDPVRRGFAERLVLRDPRGREQGPAGDRSVREVMRTEVWSVTPTIRSRTRSSSSPGKSSAPPGALRGSPGGDHHEADLLNAFVDLLDVNGSASAWTSPSQEHGRFEELIDTFAGWASRFEAS